MIEYLNALKEKLFLKNFFKPIFIPALIIFPIGASYLFGSSLGFFSLAAFFLQPVVVMILINKKIIEFKRYLIAVTPVINALILLFFFILYIPINPFLSQFLLYFGMLPVFVLFVVFLSRIASKRDLERERQEQFNQNKKISKRNKLVKMFVNAVVAFTIGIIFFYFILHIFFKY